MYEPVDSTPPGTPSHAYPPLPPQSAHLYADEATARTSFRPGASSSARSSANSSLAGDEYAEHGRDRLLAYPPSPSLPRYSSGPPSASSTYTLGLPLSSPLNPASSRPAREGNLPPGAAYSNRYSNGNGGGVHPLANSSFLASSEERASLDRDTTKTMGSSSSEKKDDYRLEPPFGAVQRRKSPPTGWRAFYDFLSGRYSADSGIDDRHVKLPRLGYLDGLKFIAAWIVLNGTFFDAVIPTSEYSGIQRGSPLYIVRSTNLGITFLLLLSGRCLLTPLWDVPPVDPTKPPQNQSTALISWARLTRAILTRTFRFLLPVIVVAALQWGLGSTGKTSNCNSVGMHEPYWNLVTSFSGFVTLIFNLFTYYEYDTLAGQTFAGNLWTNAWFFQASFAVYVIHLMLGNLSSNRYWIYGLLAVFSWTTYNYFFVAILGLVLADLHAHGQLHRIRTIWHPYQRLILHLSLLTIALLTQWVPVIRDNINSGLATINVESHPELAFCDSIFAFCLIFIVETSGLLQRGFGYLRHFGKLSAGLYLLSPAITFTIVPDLALSLSNNNTSPSTILGVTWLVLFLTTFALSIFFHLFVELPSKLLGELVCDTLEGNERTAKRLRTRVAPDGSSKLVRRNTGVAPQHQEPPPVTLV